MEDIIQQLVTQFRRTPVCREIAGRILAGERLVRVRSAPPTGAALCIAALQAGFPQVILCVTAGEEEADEFAEDLAAFGCETARRFPAFESTADELSASDEAAAAQRLTVLQTLASPGSGRGSPVGCLVASIQALRQSVIAPEQLGDSVLELAVEMPVGVETVTAWLADHDFRPGPQVEYPGEYSLRGGILDVFSHGAASPVRIEFFGDTVDSIREFDPDSQISRARAQTARIVAPCMAAGREDGPQVTLFDWLPAGALVARIDPESIAERLALLARRDQPLPDADAPPPSPLAAIDPERFAGTRQELLLERSEQPEEGTPSLGTVQSDAFGPDVDSSLHALSRLCREAARVIVFCRLEAEEKRLLDLLSDHGGDEVRGRISFVRRSLNHGLVLRDPHVALVPHHRLFQRYRQRRELQHIAHGHAVESFVDFRPGDFVVHVQYGIARFRGISVLDKEGENRDYLVLEFAEHSYVYVPADQTELVQKYVGSSAHPPELSNLHSKAWANRRKRAEEAINDLATQLLNVHAARASMKGIAYPPESELERQFAAEFPYEETPDQLEAIRLVGQDMCSPRPMDRLICGDVGYGKTEVSMRAAFKAVASGKQVAVLVPTTVLAQQHYNTFRERMADFPVQIDMLSRFRTASDSRMILTRLAEGKIDIIIGTHRLLQKDILFKDLGLVIIDEEQRFGVEHKERLKGLRRTVDILTLTATPIPRTLHMAMTGLRDIAALHTPPQDRMSVETRICTFDPVRIRHAILREMAREGQTFFVHNRVYDIHSVADTIRAIVPEARVGIAHGQMAEHELEAAMLDFIERRIDVLVCTTIIENGLDIPSANTIFLDQADHFGLAEMHQLRGRVGRYRHKAYAYLIVPERRPVTPEAQRRLQAIKQYSDLGAGFQIAIRDLEIRGAGNILGAEQSGHIAAIGYELYCKLLDRAVKRLRNEPTVEVPEVALNLKVRALLPEVYVPSAQQKLSIYRNLNRARTLTDIKFVESELIDRFGPLPEEAQNLLLEAEIRLMAGMAGVFRLERVEDMIRIETGNLARLVRDLDDSVATLRLVDETTLVVRLTPRQQDPVASARLLRKLLIRPYEAAKTVAAGQAQTQAVNP